MPTIARLASGLACLAGLIMITYAKSLDGSAEHLGILAGLTLTLIGAVASFRYLFKDGDRR